MSGEVLMCRFPLCKLEFNEAKMREAHEEVHIKTRFVPKTIKRESSGNDKTAAPVY